MKKTLTLGIVLVLLLACVGAVSANLVQNPGFESPVEGGGSYTTLTGAGLTDWTIASGGSIDLISGYWQKHTGVQSIDLAGNEAGTISQTIDVGNNQICSLSFWMAGNPDQQGVKTLEVKFGSNTRSFTFDSSGHTREAMGWEEKTASGLTATGLTTLQFVDTSSGPYGPALDDISMECRDQIPVPEFPTVALPAALIVGLIGAVLFIQKSKEE